MGNCATKIPAEQQESTYKPTETISISPKSLDDAISDDQKRNIVQNNCNIVSENTSSEIHSQSNNDAKDIEPESLELQDLPQSLQDQTTLDLADRYMTDYLLDENCESNTNRSINNLNANIIKTKSITPVVALKSNMVSLDPLHEEGIMDEMAALATSDVSNI